MSTVDYNIARVPISEKINNFPISGGRNYLILLSAPAGANVTVRLGSNQADEIPIKENFALKTSNVTEIYVNCNAVENGMLVFGQSSRSDNFEILPSPQVNKIGEINNLNNLQNVQDLQNVQNFSPALLSALDKIFHPLDTNKDKYSYISVTLTSRVEYISTILDCDEVEIFICPRSTMSNFYLRGFTIDVMLQGVYVNTTNYCATGLDVQHKDISKNIILKNTKNKRLQVFSKLYENDRLKLDITLIKRYKKV
ncbi:hypothetical protein AMRN_1417 [Malaciobacter marinus]|uniref:Uncharacterized protein n=1 Tax=Malaciobacter marinus TaxID=505249 RepID=A0A347TKM5_9BACT|nr:hypothetical protein [Malaciobacter marinus]AXX87153.1 hypothetical protein AMRN_1417 [Malaciobacter marinus]PHO14816.1 hypothetical protein CPH92_09525 [Malaciobacter marinus]